jgi:hypothetical protein
VATLGDIYINGNALKDFALADIQSKDDIEFGKKVAKDIIATLAGTTSYYWLRNARFKINRDWYAGKINIQQRYSDRFDMNGKFNYMNLNWSAIKLVNTIISRLVGRWMERNEKIHVTAIDELYINQKDVQSQEAEFILDNKQLLAQLQQQSGMPMIKPDDFVPEDQNDLEVWKAEHNHLPEEIKYEKKTNDILYDNGWFTVVKKRVLNDSGQVGLIGGKVSMDNRGVIKIRYVKPENAIYSYSEYDDFRDCIWMGEKVSRKISEVRAMYPNMPEEELFKLVATAKQYQLQNKLTWQQQWVDALLRPYDDWNVDLIDFQFKTYNTDTISSKTSKAGTKIVKINQYPIPEGATVTKKDKWVIYEGCYCQEADMMLNWNQLKNGVRPQDPTELGEAEFSYAFHLYQNNDMRNIAIPEKIEAPIDGMILALLKIQQCIAGSTPPGAAINEDAVQAIDYGLGEEGNKTIDPVKFYKQTGTIYYRGRDAEGNPIPVPIQELQNTGFLPQMQAYFQDYQFHYGVLQNELGENPNLINAATQPRVAAENIQTAQQESVFATDYMYDAYLYLTEDIGRKVSCLLYDSVRNSSDYTKDVSKEDINGRVFSTEIKMLPDEAELQQLNAMMNQAITSNPELWAYLDVFAVMRQAKEDVKLGELMYQQAQKRYINSKMQQAQAQSQYNAQVQVQSMQAKAQSDAQLKMLEGQLEMSKTKAVGEGNNKSAVINMVAAILSKGLPIDPTIQPLVNATIQNLMLPMAIEDVQIRNAAIQQMQQAQQAQQQPNQQQQIQQGQQPQQQTPQTAAA